MSIIQFIWGTAVSLLLCAYLQPALAAETKPLLLDPWASYLSDAQFLDSQVSSPPIDGNWVDVTLPHLTPVDNPTPRTTWYRFKITKPQNIETIGVYVWRYNMNVQVWLNGEVIGGQGAFSQPITRNWNRPLLTLAPQSVWQEGENELHIRLATYPGWGFLAPPIIDEYQHLEGEYQSRFFWQIRTNQISAVISVVTALIMLVFWWSNRSQQQYLMLSLLGAVWTFVSVSNFLQESPLSPKAWWWTVHLSLDAFSILLTLFLRRLLLFNFGLLDKCLLAILACQSVFYASIEVYQIALWAPYSHLPTFLVLLGTLVTTFYYAVRRNQSEIRAFAICLLVIMVFVVHDYLMISTFAQSMWRSQVLWIQLGAPVLFITMLVMLSYQHAKSLQRRLDTEQLLRIERERIYSDIHDDVGSKLLSLVYAAESREDYDQAELARETLRDTRAIVAGAMTVEGDLEEILEVFYSEVQQRCDETGVNLTWNQDGLEGVFASDTFRYHVQRIFREVISNSLKHAHPDHIYVNCSLAKKILSISIADDGASDVDTFKQGTGISGIKRRTIELNGDVTWQTTHPGCLVSLQLPLSEYHS